ncbi:hypothetical protein [Streptomyces hygroscopicus]|uniref:hypothetical protein n=1 Tax=Streptomyces hygroscopicus TaxID=1912 RepID=UPI001BDE29F0|nr:hypothetical protein [Streptomyces hygroscopicus]
MSSPFDATLVRIGARLLTGGMADVPSSSTGSPPPTKPEPTCALSPLAHGLLELVRACTKASFTLMKLLLERADVETWQS